MQANDSSSDQPSACQRSRPFSTSFAQSVDPVNPPFQHFDEEALFTSLHERIDYLRAFLDFTHEDVEALNDIVPLLEPLVDGLVDKVYAHLFAFDVTKKTFMPRPEDAVVGDAHLLTDIHDLRLDAEQILKRKKFFKVYIRKLVSADYNDFATWQYFDQVGLMHTGEAALKHRRLAGKEGLHVDLIHLTALLAWVQDALIPVILNEPTMPPERKIRTIRSLSKVMWIQNDLFSRHYTVRSHDAKAVSTALKERDEDLKASRTLASLSNPWRRRRRNDINSCDMGWNSETTGAGNDASTSSATAAGSSEGGSRPPGAVTRHLIADPDATFGPVSHRKEKRSFLKIIGL